MSNNGHNEEYNYNNALIMHVLRSRRIYESIVNNMRVEDEMLSDAISYNNSHNVNNVNNVNNINSNINTNTNTNTNNNSNRNIFNPLNNSVNTTNIGNISPSTTYTNNYNTNLSSNASNSSSVSNASNSSFSRNINRSLFYPTLIDIITRSFRGDETENRGLTNEQIEESITDTIFEQLSELSRMQNNTCPITLDSFESNSEVSYINKCGHVFFREPLRNWLSRNNTCPTCRTLLLDTSNTDLDSQSQSQSLTTNFQLSSANNNNFSSRLFLLPSIGTLNPNTTLNLTSNENDISTNNTNPTTSSLTSLVDNIFNQVIMGSNNTNSTTFDLDASGNPRMLFQISSHYTPFNE